MKKKATEEAFTGALNHATVLFAAPATTLIARSPAQSALAADEIGDGPTKSLAFLDRPNHHGLTRWMVLI
jgi:hypothetical protein